MDDFVIIEGSGSGVERDFYLESFIDQLESSDLSTRVIDITELHISKLCNARGFIFFNVSYSDKIRRFVEEGANYNKSFFLLSINMGEYPSKELIDLVGNHIGIGYEAAEKDLLINLPYKMSEKVLGKLDNENTIEERDSIFINVDEDLFSEISGSIESFFDIYKKGKLYSVSDSDSEPELDSLSERTRLKVELIDDRTVKEIVKAANNCRVGIIQNNGDEITEYIKRVFIINKTPIIEIDPDDDNHKIDHEILVGQRNIDSELYHKSYDTSHESGSVYRTVQLRDTLTEILRPSVGINIPGGHVGGGVLVALKHAQVLQKAGYDVTMLSDQIYDHQRFFDVDGSTILCVAKEVEEVSAHFNKLVATLWNTYYFVTTYRKTDDRYYLVQGFETDFTSHGYDDRIWANRTYFDDKINYVAVSPWCKDWLENDYDRKDVSLALNGINLDKFPQSPRNREGKFKILIEGNPNEPFRGVDEAFKIVNELDRDKYEVHFLCTREVVKDWYKPDKTFFAIPHKEVSQVYSGCDLLLKCSVLESFSYPPLEMMATGGVCVIAHNDGNSLYAEDGKNCYVYQSGDVQKARKRIIELTENHEIYEKFVNEGLKTVKKYSWDDLESSLLDAYSA